MDAPGDDACGDGCAPAVFTKVAAAGGFSCGLAATGGIYCWGFNTAGELGDGTTTSHLRPTQVGTSTDWIDVDTRLAAACGLQRDHSMWCWGRGVAGQLGDGMTMTERQPTQVLSDKPGVGWSAMAVGRDRTCGIHEDGSLACWGLDRTTGQQVAAPAAVDANTDWTAISVGTVTCGLRGEPGAPGALYCWGQSSRGDLGLGETTSQATPARVGTDTWRRVEIGQSNTCGIRSDGALLCWGDNPFSATLQYGDTPQQVGTATDWQSISISSSGIIGLRSGGIAYAWGDNTAGQLGQPSLQETPEPSLISGSVTSWSDISSGNTHGCGIANGHLYCWGTIGDGIVGNGASTHLYTPTRIGNEQWTAAATGLSQCGIRSDGALLCWGGYDIGFGTADPVWAPTRLGSATWTSVVSSANGFGADATCAIRGGVPYCWGDNASGALGIGSTATRQLTPAAVKVPDGTQWTEIAISGHACAIKSDATLWCWGGNDVGQLGTGTRSPSPSLAPTVPLAGAWLHVAVSQFFGTTDAMTCGIKTDHTLWCWGVLQNGAIATVPTQLGTDSTWVSLSLDNSLDTRLTACAVRANGTLWCWGDQPGGAGTGNRSTDPVQVGTASDWSSVAVGGKICAIKTSGTLWCWSNAGIPGTSPSPEYHPGGDIVALAVPTQLGSDADWTAVTSSNGFDQVSCATKTDGSLWCWGDGAAPLPRIVPSPVQIN